MSNEFLKTVGSLPQYQGLTQDEVAESLYEEFGADQSKKTFYEDVLGYDEPGFVDEFSKGLKRNFGQLGVLADEGAEAAFKSAIGDKEGAAEAALQAQEKLDALNEQYPAAVQSYKDADSLKDKSQFGGRLMGEGLGSALEIAIPALVGGGIGLGARTAGKSYIKHALRNNINKVTNEIKDEALEKSLTSGTLSKLVQKPLGKYGAAAGAYQETTRAETGSTYLDLLFQEEVDAPGLAFLAGSIKGGLENLPEFAAFARISKQSTNALADSSVRAILRRLGLNVPKEVLKVSAGETLTEVAQQEVDILAEQFVNDTLGGPQDIDQLIDAGFAGAFGGIPFGAVAGAAQTYQDASSPITRTKEELSESVDPDEIQDFLSEEDTKRLEYDLDEDTDAFVNSLLEEHNAAIAKIQEESAAEISKGSSTAAQLEQLANNIKEQPQTAKDYLLRREDDIVARYKETGDDRQLILDLDDQSPVAKQRIFKRLFPRVTVPDNVFNEDAVSLGRSLEKQRADEFGRYTGRRPEQANKDNLPDAKLPKDLSKIKPRYRDAEIKFDSDVARAAYTVANSKSKSKREDSLLDWLTNVAGIENPRALGNQIKKDLKDQYSKRDPDSTAPLVASLPGGSIKTQALPENITEYTDDLGGRALIRKDGKNARIVDMQSVPQDKKYTSEEAGFKRRGFLKNLISQLSDDGFDTLTVNLQSGDSRAALKRLVDKGLLINPRNFIGISTDQHPTTFDINKEVLKKQTSLDLPIRTPVFRPTDQWELKYKNLRGNLSRLNSDGWQTFKKDLEDAVRSVTGDAFTVRFMQNLQLFDNPLQANDSVTLRGAQHGNLIFVAMDYNSRLNYSNVETAMHEAFHAVYQSFSDAEKAVLENNRSKIADYLIDKTGLQKYDLDIMDTEELAASAFGHYALGKLSDNNKGAGKLGPVQRLLQKVHNVLKAINRSLRKKNIKSFEQLFDDTLAGQYARDDIKDILDDNRLIRAQEASKSMSLRRADQLMNQFANNTFVPSGSDLAAISKDMRAPVVSMTNIQKGIAYAFNTSPGLATEDPAFAPIWSTLSLQNKFQNVIDKTISQQLHDVISQISKQRLTDSSTALAYLDQTEQELRLDKDNRIIYKDEKGNYRKFNQQVSSDILTLNKSFKTYLGFWVGAINDKITGAEGYKNVDEAIAAQQEIAEDEGLPDATRKSARKRLREFKSAKQNLKQLREMISSNKAYFPRSAMGEFGIKLISKKNPEEDVRFGFAMLGKDWNGRPSRKEFDEIVRRWKEEYGYSEKDYIFPKYSVDNESKSSIFELTSNAGRRRLRKAGLYESVEFLVSVMAGKDARLAELVEAEMYEISDNVRKLKMNPSFIQREDKLLPSKDYPSMVSNYFAAGNRAVMKYRYSDVNAEILDALDLGRSFVHPETGEKVQIPESKRELFKKIVEYNLSPTNDWSRMRAFNFFWALGANASTAALQLFTLPIQVVGTMQLYNGNFITNNAHMAKSVALATKILGKDFKGIQNLGNYEKVLKAVDGDVRLANAIVTADRFGIFKPGRVEDYLGTRQFTSGLAPGGVTAKGNIALDAAKRVLGGPIQIAEETSRLSAFLAYYNTLREDVHGGDALAKLEKNYLKENLRWQSEARLNENVPQDLLASLFLIEDTHAIFGKLGRGMNQMGPFGAMLFPFMQHPLMMMGLMVRLWQASPEGKLAVSYMIGAMFLMSGMFAVPGWELWKTLIEQTHKGATGRSIDLGHEMKNWLHLTGNLSPEVSEALIDGGVKSFLGVDIARRIGLPIIGGDHLAHFLAGNAAPEEFLGVAGSYLKGAKDGMGQLEVDELPQGMAMLLAPVAMKNMMKAYQWRSEGVTTNRGTQTMTAEEFSTPMMIQKAFGFQPSQVSRESQKRWVERLGESGHRDAYNKLTTNLAQIEKDRILARKEGNDDKVADLTEEWMSERRKIAELMIKVGRPVNRDLWNNVNNQVAAKLRQMYFPDVPRRKVPQVEAKREAIDALYERE